MPAEVPFSPALLDCAVALSGPPTEELILVLGSAICVPVREQAACRNAPPIGCDDFQAGPCAILCHCSEQGRLCHCSEQGRLQPQAARHVFLVSERAFDHVCFSRQLSVVSHWSLIVNLTSAQSCAFATGSYGRRMLTVRDVGCPLTLQSWRNLVSAVMRDRITER